MIPYEERRRVALAILTSDAGLSRNAGSFCGQVAVDASPLSEKQLKWLEQLAEKAGVALEVE